MKPPCGPSRRQFCVAAGALAATAASARRVGAAACNGPVSAGTVASITSGTFKRVTGTGYDMFIGRDAQGIYAMSSACTHAGCTLTPQASQLSCPCHGATFDLNGQNPTSPATLSLAHYALSIDSAGNVYVDFATTVPATTRAS
jgi:cytochrome b6-f complex iron-sulfur subunit